jgi:hypothetical protein
MTILMDRFDHGTTLMLGKGGRAYVATLLTGAAAVLEIRR